MACDAFNVNVLKRLRFHLSTLETERFQTSPLLKPFSKVSVFIGVFGRFRMDDTRNRIKKVCAFKRKRISVNGALGLGQTLNLRPGANVES